MRKPKTNDELVRHAMNYAPTGALMHAFVLQGLDTFAAEVVNAEPPEPKAGTLLPPHWTAWQACAEHWLTEAHKFYNRSGPALPLKVGDRILSLKGEHDDDDGEDRHTGPNAWGEVKRVERHHDNTWPTYNVWFDNGTSVWIEHEELRNPLNYRTEAGR